MRVVEAGRNPLNSSVIVTKLVRLVQLCGQLSRPGKFRTGMCKVDFARRARKFSQNKKLGKRLRVFKVDLREYFCTLVMDVFCLVVRCRSTFRASRVASTKTRILGNILIGLQQKSLESQVVLLFRYYRQFEFSSCALDNWL